MKFQDLKVYDTSLELLHPSSWEGDIQGIAGVDSPRPFHIVYAKNPKTLSRLGRFTLEKDFSRTGVILEKELAEKFKKKDSEEEQRLSQTFAFVAQTDNVNLSMALLSKPFYDQKCGDQNHYVDGRQMGTVDIHPTAFIAQGVFLGENVKIGANSKILPGSVVMSNCEIGTETLLFPNTTLYPFVKIGNKCRIHSGTVIGADGFGYHFEKGIHYKIWHVGGVHIEDSVEIGANSAVDSGTFSPTLISEGSKLDNFVQIGHNCRLGKGVILCGHVAIGGSSIIGDFTVFGGKAGMGSDISLGKGCQVAGGALVNCDWPDRSVLGGHPARPLKEWMRGLAYLRKKSLSSSAE